MMMMKVRNKYGNEDENDDTLRSPGLSQNTRFGGAGFKGYRPKED